MFCKQLKEQEIKRQFQDAAKIQQKQFKVYRSHQLAKTSKAEQKELTKRMKEEQLRRMAMLSQQYDTSIAEMIERQNVSLLVLCLHLWLLHANLCSYIVMVMKHSKMDFVEAETFSENDLVLLHFPTNIISVFVFKVKNVMLF